jgi:uncharacterized LabA/DUF88 family protein
VGSTLPAYWRLPVKYAVLIDGGFIRRRLGSPAAPMTLLQVKRFIERLREHPALSQSALYRIYWYDAQPLEGIAKRPLKGGQVNFGDTTRARTQRALLRDLGALPHVSIRRGDLVFRGWRIRNGRLPERDPSVTLAAADLEPNIQQKGVDMRIGLDIASLTMKRHADIVVLVSGDSDFVPAMKFARREGAQLYLVPLGHGVRSEMLEHADVVLEIETERAPLRRKRDAHAA